MSKSIVTTGLILSSLSGIAIAANTADQQMIQEQNFNSENPENYSPSDQAFVPTRGTEGGVTGGHEGNDSSHQNDQGETFNPGNK